MARKAVVLDLSVWEWSWVRRGKVLGEVFGARSPREGTVVVPQGLSQVVGMVVTLFDPTRVFPATTVVTSLRVCGASTQDIRLATAGVSVSTVDRPPVCVRRLCPFLVVLEQGGEVVQVWSSDPLSVRIRRQVSTLSVDRGVYRRSSSCPPV